MKRRAVQPESPTDPLDVLCVAFARLQSAGEVRAFLEDLCTPAEIEAMSDRWRVIPELLEHLPYRALHDRPAVSVTTVGRVARCLERGAGGYRIAAQRCGLVHEVDA